MRAMTSGASFVNHAIKNEMGKIKVLANRAQSLAAAHDQTDIQRYVGSIQETPSGVLRDQDSRAGEEAAPERTAESN